jgi:hypothetical protein
LISSSETDARDLRLDIVVVRQNAAAKTGRGRGG